MPRFTSPLDNVRVAAPCPADWDRMTGDERSRYCDQCSLRVYNLSAMTRREAEAFISNAEGRVCVRYYRRPDGTILTKNCPVGLRALKQKVSRAAASVLSAVLGFYTGAWLHVGLGETRAVMGATVDPVKTVEPAGAPAEDDRKAFTVEQGYALVERGGPERYVNRLRRSERRYLR